MLHLNDLRDWISDEFEHGSRIKATKLFKILVKYLEGFNFDSDIIAGLTATNITFWDWDFMKGDYYEQVNNGRSSRKFQSRKRRRRKI